MKKVLLFIGVLLVPLIGLAQQTNLDCLSHFEEELKTAEDLFYWMEFDEAIEAYSRISLAAYSLGCDSLVGVSLNRIGASYLLAGEFGKALQTFASIDSFFLERGEGIHTERIKSKLYLCDTYTRLSNHQSFDLLMEEVDSLITLNPILKWRQYVCYANEKMQTMQFLESLSFLEKEEKEIRKMNFSKREYLEEIAAINSRKGANMALMGRLDAAINFYDEALIYSQKVYADNHPQTLKHLPNLAVAEIQYGDFKKAETHLRQYIKYMAPILGEGNYAIQICISHYGVLLFLKEEYRQGAEVLSRSCDYLSGLFGPNHPFVMQTRINLISCLLQFDPEKGIQQAEFIQNIKVEDFNSPAVYLGGKMSLAGLYYRLDSYSDALLELEKGFVVLNETPEYWPNPALKEYFEYQLLVIKGKVLLELGQQKNAINILRKADGLQDNIQWGTDALRFQSSLALSESYYCMNDLDNANKYLKITLERIGQVEDRLGTACPLYLSQLILVYYYKAFTFFYQYLEEGYDRGVLLKALDNYDLVIRSLDFYIPWLSRIKSQFDIQEEYFDTFEAAILVNYLAAYEENTYAFQAFRYSEKAKNRNVQKTIQAENEISPESIPPSILKAELRLENKIKKLNWELDFSNSGFLSEEDIIVKEKEILSLYSLRDDLVKYIKTEYPDYFQLKFNSLPTTVSQLQDSLLTKDQLLLEYFVGDTNLFIFAITQDTFELLRHSIDSNFNNRVAAFRNGMYDATLAPEDGFSLYTDNARYLDSLLIEPLRERYPQREMILIPDGPLHYVPFEALLAKSPLPGPPRYDRLDYLVHTYDFSYAPSATLLFQNKYRKRPEANGQILAFAPGEYSSGEPYAANEMKDQVRRLADRFKGTYFLGKKATEANFKQQDSAFAVLQLATHGILDNEYPMTSRIAFAPEPEDTSKSNGWLFASEVYELEVYADLVVLSACETGVGKLYRGEGMLNMARGFFYAGCPSIAMSLWKIEGKATAGLLDDYYSHLADGTGKGSSLTQAKRDYLSQTESDGQRSAPYYWAGLIHVGENEPIQIEKKSPVPRYAVSSLLGLALCGLLFSFLKRKPKG